MPRANPPAPLNVGDVVRMQVNILADGEQALWSLDYMANAFSVNPYFDLQLLTNQFDINYNAGIKLLLPVDCTYQGVLGIHLSRNDVQSFFVPTHAGVGTGSANHLDKQLAADCRKASALKGQHGRGRMLVGPLGTGQVSPAVDANRLNAAAIGAFQAILTAMQAAITPFGGTVTWTPCISTRPTVGSGNVVSHAVPITAMTVSPIIGTVRRRRIGRGI